MKKSSKIRNKFDMVDASKILGVSYTTILKLKKEGKLKFTKIAQKYFISKYDLNVYLNTGNIFDKPEAVIINVIKQGIREGIEENIQRIETAVKQKIIAELEENIKRNLVKINRNNKKLDEKLPKKIVEHLRYRQNEVKKEFEKV